jgi:hypothetical protein
VTARERDELFSEESITPVIGAAVESLSLPIRKVDSRDKENEKEEETEDEADDKAISPGEQPMTGEGTEGTNPT